MAGGVNRAARRRTRGVVKISHLVLNGTTLPNLDAFEAASQCLTLTVPEADTL
jgi:hypothetical protein